MAFNWKDPEWAAEQRRKIAEGLARKKAERSLAPATTEIGRENAALPPGAAGYAIDLARLESGDCLAVEYSPDGEPFLHVEHGEAVRLLRAMLDAVRVKAVGKGYLADRCLACRMPVGRHATRISHCQCPCHQVRDYLASLEAPMEKAS